jgi:hypothetical protein
MSQPTTLFSKAVPLITRIGDHPSHRKLFVAFVVVHGSAFRTIQPYIDKTLCERAGINMTAVGDADAFVAQLARNHAAPPARDLLLHIESLAERCNVVQPIQARRHGDLPSAYVLQNTPSGLLQLEAVWQKGAIFDDRAPASHIFFEQLPPLEPARFQHFCIERHGNDQYSPKLKLMRDDHTGDWGLFFLAGSSRLNDDPIRLERQAGYKLAIDVDLYGVPLAIAKVADVKLHLCVGDDVANPRQRIYTAAYQGIPIRIVSDIARQFAPTTVQTMLDLASDASLCRRIWNDAVHVTKTVMDDGGGELPLGTAVTLVPGMQPQRPSVATPTENLLRGQTNVVRLGARKPAE